MPRPDKYRESLAQFNIDKSIISEIFAGYEKLTDKSPKIKRAAFFKRAIDIMEDKLPQEIVRELLEWNACGITGARERASAEFARINEQLPLADKIAKIAKAPYMNMGVPTLSDGKLLLHAVSFVYEEHYACGCACFRRAKYSEPVSKTYCYCCAGHFRHHYEIMLGIKLTNSQILSSPLDSNGKSPCVMSFELLLTSAKKT